MTAIYFHILDSLSISLGYNQEDLSRINWDKSRDTSSFLVWITLGFSWVLPLVLGLDAWVFSLHLQSWKLRTFKIILIPDHEDFEPLVLWLLGNRINNMKTREGKVLRVLPSGRWVPRNQGWLNFWETRLVTVRKSLHRSCWTELTCQGILLP